MMEDKKTGGKRQRKVFGAKYSSIRVFQSHSGVFDTVSFKAGSIRENKQKEPDPLSGTSA